MVKKKKTKCLYCGEPSWARSYCSKHYSYILHHNVDFNDIYACFKLLNGYYGLGIEPPNREKKKITKPRKYKQREKITTCFYCGKPLYKGMLCKSHHNIVKFNFSELKNYLRTIASYDFSLVHNRDNACIVCGEPAKIQNLCSKHHSYIKRGTLKGFTVKECLLHLLETHYDKSNLCLVCGKPANIHGLCEEHFNFARNREIKFNDIDKIKAEFIRTTKSVVNIKPLSSGGCAFCEHQVFEKGFCKKHYNVLKSRNANLNDQQECLNLLQALKYKKEKRCAICGDKVFLMGLCKEHNSLAFDKRIKRSDLLALLRDIKIDNEQGSVDYVKK